jgi:hypothetical protein
MVNVSRWVGGGLTALAGAALLAAAAGVAAGTGPGQLQPAPSPTAAPCKARLSGQDWLPDPVCTPGAVNPRVVADGPLYLNTICNPGWATAERKKYLTPSAAARVKRRMAGLYGRYAGSSLAGYELDHLVPISVGGDPADPRNLWLEAPATWNPKDSVEAWVNAEVCHGRMSLKAAVAGFEGNWTVLRVQGTPTRPGKAAELDE